MKLFSLKDKFRKHIAAGHQAFRDLFRHPLTFVLTVLTIAVSLSLPGLLLAVLENSQTVIEPWQEGRQINVFLKLGISENLPAELASEWEDDGAIKSVKVITPEQALNEFKQQSDMGDALELLNENPLPATLVVTPADHLTSADEIKSLGKRLSADPGIESVLVDQEWLQRLKNFINFLQTTIWILAIIFSLLVALVVNNSLRSEILHRKKEVEVIKLIGGNNSFIQRPFLYTAVLLGTTGAALAIIIILIVFKYLAPHLEAVMQHYSTAQSPLYLGPKTALIIPLAGIGLSVIATLIAIRINLREIEPH